MPTSNSSARCGKSASTDWRYLSRRRGRVGQKRSSSRIDEQAFKTTVERYGVLDGGMHTLERLARYVETRAALK
jgi:hypothetical protein